MELNTDETNLHYCRFCSEKKKPTDLLNFLSNEEIQEQIINFTYKFQIVCLDLSIENKLPKTICSPCYNNIIQCNRFITRVSESQIVLNKIYNIKKESNEELEIKHEGNGTISANKNDYDIDSEEIPTSLKNYTVCNQNTYKSNQTKVLVKNENEIEENTVTNDSWMSYSWFCVHCKAKFTSMNALRSHSKRNHKTCFGYGCADCNEKFNVFNLFIDHVRQHRPSLRYYCQYCNQKFDTIIQCFEHSTSHSQNEQELCELCGEIMMNNKALEQHRKLFRKVRKTNRPRKITTDTLLLEKGVEASWSDYNWSCQVCCQRLPNADSLRSHVQNVHNKCFAMKCMDCTTVLKNFKTFIAHVCIHRPYLKKFCQYCNTNLNKMSISTHMKDHENGLKQACSGCGQMFQSVDLLQKHMQQFISARPAHSLTEDDLTCVICKKVFASLEKLRQHRKTHDTNRTRNYTCDSCGKAYFTLGALKSHKVTHSEKTFTCKLCQKSFHTKANLKEHVAMHLNDKPYQCDECGKGFNVKLRLKYHLSLHTDYKPHKCNVCGKAFRFTNDLKIHSRQHTGLRPYACEVCDRSFVNWSNCSKHMLGKHGVSLQKKKDKSKIDIDGTTKEWMYSLIHKENSNETVTTENKC